MKLVLQKLNNSKYIKDLYRKEAINCIKYPDNTRRAKENFFKLEALCYSSNQHDTFCANAQKLAEHLQKNGKIKLANIFFAELGKIYGAIGKTKLAEETIEKSIEISNCMGDQIHVMARLTDLEIIFKKNRNGKKLYTTLIRKIECGKQILENYELYEKNFNTISKRPANKNGIKIQMAFAYSDLADIIKHKRPNHSIKLLEKAKEIYKSLEKETEVKYLEKKIEYTKSKMSE